MNKKPIVTLAPWLSVRSSVLALKFYKNAFGAEEVFKLDDSSSVVAKLSIDGAEFWMSDKSPEHDNFSPESLGGGTVHMILTVSDPEVVFNKAVAAGARVVAPIAEEHGWRVGRVADPFGHHWEIGCELQNS